jgi:predicted RNase H-like HicB family nuclease
MPAANPNGRPGADRYICGLMTKTRDETVRTVEAHYVCTFRPEPEGGYTVRCVSFPEIVSYGTTLEEARRNAREAIELCIEVYRDEGRPLPASSASPRRTIRQIVPVSLLRA